MYEELTKRLKTAAQWVDMGLLIPPSLCLEAADAIAELSRDLDSMNDANIALYGALPKWIPVTECLPNVGEDVLLLFSHNQAAGFYDGTYWCIFSSDAYFTVVLEEDEKPTHWAKKLPEPPKEET